MRSCLREWITIQRSIQDVFDTPVGFTQPRIKHQGFHNTRFQVVRYHPFGYTSKTLEGSLVLPMDEIVYRLDRSCIMTV